MIWSSDEAQLGRLNTEYAELEEAMRGGVSSHRGHDFVNLDFNLPGMDGQQALRLL